MATPTSNGGIRAAERTQLIEAVNSYLVLIAMVIELSTRGTAHSDNWFLRLSDRAVPRRYHLLDNG